MSGYLLIPIIPAVIAGSWYLFEWLWDRRLFSRSQPPSDGGECFRNLRARKIREMLEEATPPVKIVDVRPAADFEKGRIPGAENIPFPGPEFAERITSERSLEEPILIYCSGGFRSRLATAELRRLGFRSLYHLHRGIGSWKIAGYPVERNPGS